MEHKTDVVLQACLQAIHHPSHNAGKSVDADVVVLSTQPVWQFLHRQILSRQMVTVHVVLSLHHKRPSALHAPVGLSYMLNKSVCLAVTLQNISAKQKTRIGVLELFKQVEPEQTGFILKDRFLF